MAHPTSFLFIAGNAAARVDEKGRAKERTALMTFLVSQIDSWRAELAALPPPDLSSRKVGKLAAVALMAKELQALARRGYTTGELIGVLAEKGLTVHKDTLTRALRRSRPTGAAGPAIRRRGSGSLPRPPRTRRTPGERFSAEHAVTATRRVASPEGGGRSAEAAMNGESRTTIRLETSTAWDEKRKGRCLPGNRTVDPTSPECPPGWNDESGCVEEEKSLAEALCPTTTRPGGDLVAERVPASSAGAAAGVN